MKATVEEFIVGVDIKELTPEIVAVPAQFPENYPRDPADRLLGATARVFGMPLVTKDERIRSSGFVKTIW